MTGRDRIVLAAERNAWTFDDPFRFDSPQTGHRHPDDLCLVKWVGHEFSRVNIYFDARGRMDEMVLRRGTSGRERFARSATEVVRFLERAS